MSRDIASLNSCLDWTLLPLNVLKNILSKCTVKDLGRLSQTCHFFKEQISDDLLWREICCRDFKLVNPDLGPIKSYHMLYKNLLHRYGWMFGTYISCVAHYKGLSEIKYKAGAVECVNWELEDPKNIDSPLVENTVFQIRGDSVPPTSVCFPDEPSTRGHMCSVSFNMVRGTVIQECLDAASHRDKFMEQTGMLVDLQQPAVSQFKTMLLFYCMMVLQHKPILLPSPYDIPNELKMGDGSYPSQLITPGLYKRVVSKYDVTGLQIVCFKYKNEFEIFGLEVVSGASNYDICLKILVQKSVVPSLTAQDSLEALLNCDHDNGQVPMSEGCSQPFKVPRGCQVLSTYPNTCKARYCGFMREGSRNSYFQVHVMVFSDELIGVLMLDYRKTFQTYQRIHKKFTPNILTEVESADFYSI